MRSLILEGGGFNVGNFTTREIEALGEGLPEVRKGLDGWITWIR
jgi:hypothetical protein